MKNDLTALITGCTSGIGLHLAHQFAKHGHPLVLVAPAEDELQQVRAELSSVYGVSIEICPCDLEDLENVDGLFDFLSERRISVDILVNNAGHGYRGNAWEIPLEKDLSMIRLNVEAVVRLTKHLLPAMVERNTGRILNTASVAGFEPGPLVAVYHATKAFILSWSEALAVELENSAVTVTALCPGPTDTDFFQKAGMENTVAFQKANVMSPQEVAEAGYEGMMKGEMVVVPGLSNKALVQGRRVLSERAQAKLNEKMYQEVDEEDRVRSRGDIEHETSPNKR